MDEIITYTNEIGKEIHKRQQTWFTDLKTEYRDRIANGEKIMLREVLDDLNLTTLNLATYYDPDLWGWDKKGFRQIYYRKVVLEELDSID